MKIQYSVIITLLALIVFLITLSLFIQYKSAERASSAALPDKISIGL